jgi:hypothetical protein
MNKFYIVLMLGVILLFSGCTTQQALPDPIINYVCPDGTVVKDKSLCQAQQEVVQELSIESELSVCAGMPLTQSASFENMCIIGLAGKHKDSSLCLKISQDQRVGCYALVAEIKNDPNACAEAQFLEDQCFDQYARDKKDVLACDGIKEIGYKDNCYVNLAGQIGDGTLCDKIKTADQKNSCYLNIAQRFRDTSYCNKITNESMKQNCLQMTGENIPEKHP